VPSALAELVGDRDAVLVSSSTEKHKQNTSAVAKPPPNQQKSRVDIDVRAERVTNVTWLQPPQY
jgi:hypothetical protein